MSDLLSKKEFDRLLKAIEWSEQQLSNPRKERINSIYQYVGARYGDKAERKPIPVPHLKMAVDIYVRTLAPKSPRVLATTRVEGKAALAANFELAVNEVPKEIGLDDTLRKWVAEALFSWGILKCGLSPIGSALGQEYGVTFVDVVTLDDYFVDMSAKSIDKIQYEGNSYWITMSELKEKDWTHKKNISDLDSDEYTVIQEDGGGRAEEIATGESAHVFEDRKQLRDVYLHDKGIIVTYAVKEKKKLHEVKWTGPDSGPYHKLGFSHALGNLLPVAPVSIWKDLHELANALFIKLGNQADSEKSVLGFQGGDPEQVKRFKNARDGAGIMYDGSKPEKLEAGGVNQKTLAFYLQVRDLFSYFSNNLDTLGGLGAQTETVGQDKLLSQAAGAQLADMSAKTIEALTLLFEAIAFYEWNDPIRKRKLQKQIPNSTVVIPIEFGGADKEGDIDLFDIKIDVFSLQDNSPGVKLQKILMVLKEVVMPLMPFAPEGVLEVQSIFELVGRYADIPEIRDMVSFPERPPIPGEAGGTAAGKPPETTRTYEHVGKPGMTREGASNQVQQQLLGNEIQEQG